MVRYYLYILFIFIPIIAFGQGQVGVKAGYIFYKFSTFDEYSHPEYNYSPVAFSVAVSLRQRLKATFNHGVEIEYTYRSFSVKSYSHGGGGGSSADFSYTIGTLYLHFQPQFTFGSKPKFFIYPGFYFGTLIHSSLNGIDKHWSYNPQVSTADTINGTAKGYYPNFEFGLTVGFGIDYPISNNLCIVFESRMTMNLSDIGDAWEANPKMLSANFEIGLAYTFSRITGKDSTKNEEKKE